MEDILYDIHMAQNMDLPYVPFEERGLREITMRKSIFDKYGVSQEQWDTSFSYYCRHTDKLYDIYESLSERLRQNVIAAGGEIEGGFANGDDTLNVWTKERSFVLMPTPPYNLKTFNIDADSTYLPGDRLTLSYKTQFIFQDGMRDLVCLFAVTLKNDSVISEMRHVNNSDQVTSLTLEDWDGHGIKNIRIYFMPARNLSEDLTTTLKLISVSNVRMIRNHSNRAQKDTDKVRGDSLKTKGDSAESVREEHVEDVPVPAINGDVPPPMPHRPLNDRHIQNMRKSLPAEERPLPGTSLHRGPLHQKIR